MNVIDKDLEGIFDTFTKEMELIVGDALTPKYKDDNQSNAVFLNVDGKVYTAPIRKLVKIDRLALPRSVFSLVSETDDSVLLQITIHGGSSEESLEVYNVLHTHFGKDNVKNTVVGEFELDHLVVFDNEMPPFEHKGIYALAFNVLLSWVDNGVIYN